VAEAVWRKSVCGLQYHVWHVGTENSNFIEKKVSRRTEKSSTLNHFSPFFLCQCCSLIITSGRQKWQRKNWSVVCDIMCGALALKLAF
jgi:hypothetical protein